MNASIVLWFFSRQVDTVYDVMCLVQHGLHTRRESATMVHEHSSRSHLVVTLTVVSPAPSFFSKNSAPGDSKILIFCLLIFIFFLYIINKLQDMWKKKEKFLIAVSLISFPFYIILKGITIDCPTKWNQINFFCCCGISCVFLVYLISITVF